MAPSFEYPFRRLRPLSSGDAGWLADWAAFLPPESASELSAGLRDGRLADAIFGPISLARYMWDAKRAVPALTDALRRATASLSPGQQLVWLIDAGISGQGGLEQRDIEPLFAAYSTIDALHLAALPDGHRRIALYGTVRWDALAVGCALSKAFDPDATPLLIETIERASVPGLLLFISAKQARLFSKTFNSPSGRDLRQRIKNLVQAGRLAAVLDDVADTASDPAASLDLGLAAAALRRLFGRAGLLGLRYAGTLPERSTALTEAMQAAQLVANFSFRADDLRRSPQNIVRLSGAYYDAGCYQPLPFDRRMPAAIYSPDATVEIIGHDGSPLTTETEWERFWDRLAAPRTERLSRLLAYKRLERYLQDLGEVPALNRWYHEFVVFNWPAPDPATRARFIDLGSLASPAELEAALDRASSFAARRPPAVSLVGPTEFLLAAKKEAAGRCRASAGEALADQVASHHYLGEAASSDPNAPLAPNLADFVDFIDDHLGETLEIGAGYGQLARALSPRASRYICTELNGGFLSQLDRRRNEFGLAADVHTLPFEDESFDTVIANNVLEHFYDPIAALRSLRRVLRPGGHLFALVPLDALNSDYDLPAHLWKIDEIGFGLAFSAAGYAFQRAEVVDVQRLGMTEAFPSCEGLCLKVDAIRG